jgi:pilus assembly protein CpaB
MNLKKIWLWSLILGMTVAVFAYFTVLPNESASTATNTEEVKSNQAEEEAEVVEEDPFKREIANPMVEIAKGLRAISINVDLAPGVSGYVEPESKVDVIAYETTKDEKKKKEYKSAVLILENVKVLTSGKSADTKQEALHYQTVTLEVTPEQGVILGLASRDKDGFYLMLRNELDTQTGKQGYKETREVIKEDKEEEKK